MATSNDKDFGFNAVQVIILDPLVVPGLFSCHMAIPVRHLGKPMQTFDGSVKSPYLETGIGFDQIQHPASSRNVSLECEDDLQPSNVWIRPLYGWSRVDDLVVASERTSEQIRGSFLDDPGCVEGSVVPRENDFVSPHTCDN